MSDVLFSDFVVQATKEHAAPPAGAASQAATPPVTHASAGSTAASAEPPVFPGLMDVTLPIAVRLGSGTISVGACLSLRPQSIIRLAQSVGVDLDIVVNGETVARGSGHCRQHVDQVDRHLRSTDRRGGRLIAAWLLDPSSPIPGSGRQPRQRRCRHGHRAGRVDTPGRPAAAGVLKLPGQRASRATVENGAVAGRPEISGRSQC